MAGLYMFDADQLRADTFARHVEVHDILSSTNDRAAELARSTDIELPALVVAREQTAGRGRGRNIWWSADGALTFSVLIDAATTGVLPANWPQLSLATAVAVCDALAHEIKRTGSSLSPVGVVDDPARCGARVGVKWPNDVWLDGGKVCGILIESLGSRAPEKDRLIIGVGINVNNSWKRAPRAAGSHGAALCDVTADRHDQQAVLVRFLAALASRILQLRTRDVALVRDWQELDVLAGRTVRVENNGKRIEGTCAKIAYDGALVVDTVFGPQRLFSGTVHLA